MRYQVLVLVVLLEECLGVNSATGARPYSEHPPRCRSFRQPVKVAPTLHNETWPPPPVAVVLLLLLLLRLLIPIQTATKASPILLWRRTRRADPVKADEESHH